MPRVQALVDRCRVFLADPFTVVRAGIGRLINAEPDVAVVGEAATSYQMFDQLATLRPHIVSLETSIAGPGTTATAAHIFGLSPRSRLIVLTDRNDPAQFHVARLAGVHGYVLKSSSAKVHIEAIRRVASGATFIDETANVSDVPKPAKLSGKRNGLSVRETEVLSQLVQGLTHQEIGTRLHLSKKSIDTYCMRIRAKTGLKTRADFIYYGLDAGLRRPGGDGIQV